MSGAARLLSTVLLALASMIGASSRAADLDAADAAWTALLRKHVVLVDDGRASRVDYAALLNERGILDRYTTSLSSVSKADFERLPPPGQKAFLINAYNAFTVQLILTRYPDLASIRDLGTLFTGPWKPRFIPLLGGKVSLDAIEHEMLRAPGRYGDPRVHFALNCASIGCPALREEAYVAERLDAQLDDQARRFMSDRKRNRFDAKERTLRVSKVFDWYGDDFAKGDRGIRSLRAFFARYADQLADAPEDREVIRREQAPIAFTDYDWRLNDRQR